MKRGENGLLPIELAPISTNQTCIQCLGYPKCQTLVLPAETYLTKISWIC